MSAIFGPAGTGISFNEMGYKHSTEVFQYLKHFDLDCFEYQCGHGVRVKEETANAIGFAAEKEGVILTLHAPYYISLSSIDEEKRDNSVKYILDSARAADWMGAKRIVIHSGSAAKLDRATALEYAKQTLKKSLETLDENKLGHITVCPETMGRINLLGTLEEVIELCQIDERLIPCVDFGHLNARTFGGLKKKSDFEDILDKIQNALGDERMKNLHIHFTKIEYSKTAGEVKHLTFEDKKFGPEFRPLCELIIKKNMSPIIICESNGTQTEDAQTMKLLYNKMSV